MTTFFLEVTKGWASTAAGDHSFICCSIAALKVSTIQAQKAHTGWFAGLGQSPRFSFSIPQNSIITNEKIYIYIYQQIAGYRAAELQGKIEAG